MLSRLYRRNLAWQQAEVRWRAFQAFGRVTGRCSFGWKGAAVCGGALCVFLLDVILGACVAWLWGRWDVGEALQAAVSDYTLSILRLTRDLLDWVMGSPAGLKLNAPLGQFLGSRCLSILGFWELFYRDFLSHYLPFLLTLLPPLSSLGVTLVLAVLHDFFKFLNLCLICFHIFSSRLLRLQLSGLTSLGRLFMGRKWNILRHRVDSCEYDTSQLLVGTVLFTILLFLLPTTLIFAFLFFSLRVGQWAVQLALRVVVVGINWTTFCGYRLLNSIGEDAAISSAKVEVGRSGDVRVVWNGRRWNVEEMRKVVDNYPVPCVLGEVCGVREEEEEETHQLLTIAGLWSTL